MKNSKVLFQSKHKVAICFFGHLRTFCNCAPDLYRHLLRHYDCDLFMHTWSTINHNTPTWHKNSSKNTLTNRDDIIKAYGMFRGLEIEEQHPEDWGVVEFCINYSAKPSNISLFGMDAMYHSMRRVSQLRLDYQNKHHIKYDYVFFVRPDILLKKDINISDLLSCLSPEDGDKGFFTLANPILPIIKDFSSLGATDCLFFAKPLVMDKVISNLGEIRKMFEKTAISRTGPEFELIRCVQKQRFIPYYLDFRYDKDFTILRLSQKVKLRKRIIRLRLFKDKRILLWILPHVLPHIFDVRANLFGFNIDFALGHPKREI